MAWTEPVNFRLGTGEAVVYRVRHAQEPALAALAPQVLTTPELARAQRYFQAADRQRFLVVRTALRLLLGRYAGQPPATIELELGPNKKPRLKGTPGLRFSVSHTKEWALLALANQELGVDVEVLSAEFDFASLLAGSFAASERRAIGHDAGSRSRFYQLWTRKEAFAKATGQGIDEHFAFIPALDGVHQLDTQRFATDANWLVTSFPVAEACVASLAYPAQPLGLTPQFLALPALDALY